MSNDWNGDDGINSAYNSISLGMKEWVSSLTTTIEHIFEMHPSARLLCMELLSFTVDFFRKMSSMMQILYCEVMVRTFGSDHLGKNPWPSVGRLFDSL